LKTSGGGIIRKTGLYKRTRELTHLVTYRSSEGIKLGFQNRAAMISRTSVKHGLLLPPPEARDGSGNGKSFATPLRGLKQYSQRSNAPAM
jgi:hypothetical protein